MPILPRRDASQQETGETMPTEEMPSAKSLRRRISETARHAGLTASQLEQSRSPVMRFLGRKLRPRTTATGADNMLPVLIQVFAGFAKVDGQIDEQDIDSTLSFLRYDYPEGVYSELQKLYSHALKQPQDLNVMARELAARLSQDEKILLGAQLFVLISKGGDDLHKEQLLTFYRFMTNLGIASQAIDLVYQINAGNPGSVVEEKSSQSAGMPLETLSVAGSPPADVVFESLSDDKSLTAFRLQNLLLLKNTGRLPAIVRGRELRQGEFCRIYEGQRVLLGGSVLSYQELLFYFNAKKDLFSNQLYLGLGANGAPFIERSPTKQSYLEIKFGLHVTIVALRETPATVHGQRLHRGAHIRASLQDRLTFDNRMELAFIELRRRAREMGGRFELHPSRSEYLISNNPNLLRPGDILLSRGVSGEVLLRIRCDYDRKTGDLEILNAHQPVLLEGEPVREKNVFLQDGAIITIAEGQFLRCHFADRIIEEERNIISRLEIREVAHRYDGKETALDGISLTARRGEMVCVMGPSGCGKSTLLRALSGHLRPSGGEILLNGFRLYENSDHLKPYVALIPQDDSFDPLLTIQENIDCAAAIRAPHLRSSERLRRVDAKLVELGLNERKHRLAGTPKVKHLSGGERKRLNVGMDMIGIADVYLFDEPTSGLSSKDSEHVLEIIHGLSSNKIVFVSIHQPSARLFHMFDKALLLDHGGKMAFFGTPHEMLEYFREAQRETIREGNRFGGSAPSPAAPEPVDGQAPDVIFDILEKPLRDLSGAVIHEEDSRGHLMPARRFSPNFWRDRYQAHHTMQELSEISPEETAEKPRPRILPRPPGRSLRDERVHFLTLLKRAFLSKLRNRANLVTTLLEAPFLALLMAMVLRFSEDGDYTLASAYHIPTYLFLTLVVAMFLGLTNSADEILRDRQLLTRERNYNVRLLHYVACKILTLGFFAACQCVIYLLVANAILEVRGMFWQHLVWMFLTTLSGVVTGLVISCLVSDAKTALNIIPVILIPQIILGGALIKYEEMNRNLDFVYSLRRWTNEDVEELSDLRVPLICEFMPLRWSYEAVVIAQARENPVSRLHRKLETEIRELSEIPIHTPDQAKRFKAAKNALPIIYSLEAPYPRKLRRQLIRIYRHIREGRFQAARFSREYPEPKVVAREIYVNRKVEDLVTRAEAEYEDHRRDRDKPFNVFFGLRKNYLGFNIGTLRLNFIIMLTFIMLTAVVLYAILRRQLTRTS